MTELVRSIVDDLLSAYISDLFYCEYLNESYRTAGIQSSGSWGQRDGIR